MNIEFIKIWNGLKTSEQHDIFNEVSAAKNLPPAAIEKDWWVVRTLEVVFNTSIAPHTVFKGGTSLSKAWGLIDRFSEDIDLALDRKFLSFKQEDKEMNGSQLKKLRKTSFGFISDKYYHELQKKFKDVGFGDIDIRLGETTSNDQDPLIIEIHYPPVTPIVDYIKPRILIEVGSRSLIEPFENRSFCSLVGEHYLGKKFADGQITIPTVTPERTFFEKIFLLHEEFQQDLEKVRIERKSRHLYDLEKLMDSEYAVRAMADIKLYHTIIEHRKLITPLRGISYDNHVPSRINPIPPDPVLTAWEDDYSIMQESMIAGNSVSFAALIERMKILKGRINAMVSE